VDADKGLYRKIRQVDITGILARLPEVNFVNTGGTNGWVARPDWARPFVESLNPEGAVTFICLRKLPPYQNIPPHIDNWGNTPNRGKRYHVPLVTHPDVKMCWPDDGVSVHMEAGWLYEVCFLRLHEVVHLAPVDRIHLHYNVVGRA
jgi:hypothetical protein